MPNETNSPYVQYGTNPKRTFRESLTDVPRGAEKLESRGTQSTEPCSRTYTLYVFSAIVIGSSKK